MNEEQLQKEFEKMNIEEVDMLSDCCHGNAPRSARVLALVYEKTGVDPYESHESDVPATDDRPASALSRRRRLLPALAAALAVLAILIPVMIVSIGRGVGVGPSGSDETAAEPSLSEKDVIRLTLDVYEDPRYVFIGDRTADLSTANLSSFDRSNDNLIYFINSVSSRETLLDPVIELSLTVRAMEKNAALGAYPFLKNVSEAIIGEGVVRIAANAFKDARFLTSVTLPASLTEIGDGAFDGCSGLISVTVPPENPTFKVDGNKLIEKETGKVVFTWTAAPKAVNEAEN